MTIEKKTAGSWVDSFDISHNGLPFSFIYGSKKSSDILSGFGYKMESSKPDNSREKRTYSYSDSTTGLVVRAEVILYTDFPAVEWVLHFKNTGKTKTPILENIQALDTCFVCNQDKDPVLHYAKGALCSPDDFAPLERIIRYWMKIRLQAGGGRSSSEYLPFFNIDNNGEGAIIAIGWTGEWAAEFSRDEQKRLRVQAGMDLTHFFLYPGEEVRSPRILLLFWHGDRMRGHNMLREFILAHHRPEINGAPFSPPVCIASWGGTPATFHQDNIKKLIARDVPFDYYWIDAEWFGGVPWHINNGNWEHNINLYPNGFKPISDLLHKNNRKFLLWFEPQRVCKNTKWDKEHRDWLLEIPKDKAHYRWKEDGVGEPDWIIKESLRNQIGEGDALLNLGIPEARQFLTDYISNKIKEYGIDCYREDFNIAPLEFWRCADSSDRQGITEIRYVEGLYAFWDGLLAKHPGLIIDNCASGGRRIDLETISRSTPFCRTDYAFDLTAKQCHTYGLLSWVPLHSTGGGPLMDYDRYKLRSDMCSGIALVLLSGDVSQPNFLPDDFPYEEIKFLLNQYIDIRKFYLGDYYPLTNYTRNNDSWMVYQLNLPDSGEGLVVVLKRPSSNFTTATLPLKELRTGANYTIRNLDTNEKKIISGDELMDTGFEVQLFKKPDSALIHYQKRYGGCMIKRVF